MIGYAAELGITGDVASYIADADPSTELWDAPAAAKPFIQTIEADIELAETLDANATPHFFINGRRISGARHIDEFTKLLDTIQA